MLSLLLGYLILTSATCGASIDPRQQGQETASASPSQTTHTSSVSPSSTAAARTIDLPVNFTIDGKIFPPSVYAAGVKVSQDFSVNCMNCFIEGNISASGGDSLTTPPPMFEAAGKGTGFGFDTTWVGAILDDLSAHFDLAINLTASNASNELVVPLISLSRSASFGPITLTATFTPEIHGWVNTSTNVNFTHGFNFTITPGAGLLIDAEQLNKTQTYEFNQTNLTPLPYTATTDAANIGIELSFRPILEFTVDILGDSSAGVDVTTYFDVPKLDLQVSQVHNALDSCDPAPAGTPADQIFANLTLISSSLGFDAAVGFTETEIFAQQNQGFEKSFTIKNFFTTCLAFDPTKETMVPAAQAKVSDTKIGNSAAVNIRASTARNLIAVAFMIFISLRAEYNWLESVS